MLTPALPGCRPIADISMLFLKFMPLAERSAALAI